MIASVTCDIAGQPQTLKFSTRAQARVERELDASISVVMIGMRTRFGIRGVAEIIAASMSEGRGVSVETVYNLIDEIGHEEAHTLVGKLVDAAFPPAKDDEGANPPKK